MKLLIDTSLKTFFISLIKNEETIFFIKEEIQKKADRLPSAYRELLEMANIKTTNIKEIYVTNGPGSFMGARAALIFARTMAQITNIKLFVADTLSFISGGVKGTYYIDAKSNKSYKGILDKQMTITLGDFHEDSKIDYEKIIAHPESFLSMFIETNPLIAKPNYFKSPSIGGQ